MTRQKIAERAAREILETPYDPTNHESEMHLAGYLYRLLGEYAEMELEAQAMLDGRDGP